LLSIVSLLLALLLVLVVVVVVALLLLLVLISSSGILINTSTGFVLVVSLLISDEEVVNKSILALDETLSLFNTSTWTSCDLILSIKSWLPFGGLFEIEWKSFFEGGRWILTPISKIFSGKTLLIIDCLELL